MSSTSPNISAGDDTDTNDAGPRLPYDIIAVIARVLAHGKRPLKPPRDLAALNRTSRAVYEITLPILYERIQRQLYLPEWVDVRVDIFTLDIRDDISTNEVNLVIDTVMDFIGKNAASEFRVDHALRPIYLDLRCSLAVFATLSRVMRSKLSSFLRLNVLISGETTSVKDLQQQLELLAEYYHHIWTVHQEDDNEEFVSIKARGDVAIPVDVQE